MKIGNKSGYIAVASLVASFLSPSLFNSAKITIALLVIALSFATAAGLLRPRAWFFMAGGIVAFVLWFLWLLSQGH